MLAISSSSTTSWPPPLPRPRPPLNLPQTAHALPLTTSQYTVLQLRAIPYLPGQDNNSNKVPSLRLLALLQVQSSPPRLQPRLQLRPPPAQITLVARLYHHLRVPRSNRHCHTTWASATDHALALPFREASISALSPLQMRQTHLWDQKSPCCAPALYPE